MYFDPMQMVRYRQEEEMMISGLVVAVGIVVLGSAVSTVTFLALVYS